MLHIHTQFAAATWQLSPGDCLIWAFQCKKKKLRASCYTRLAGVARRGALLLDLLLAALVLLDLLRAVRVVLVVGARRGRGRRHRLLAALLLDALLRALGLALGRLLRVHRARLPC